MLLGEYDVRRFGPIGTANDTTTFQTAANNLEGGSVLLVPPGEYRLDCIHIRNQLRIVGAGAWSTVLRSTGGTRPLIVFDLPATPPVSGVRGYYGSGVQDLGLNLEDAPAVTGIYVGVNTAWLRLESVSCRGGAVSIVNQGFNNWFENLQLFDAGKFLVIDGDTGMELTLRDVAMGRNSVGTTTVGIEVTSVDAAGVKGALMMSNVRLASGVGGGVETTAGMIMTAPSPGVSLPLFARGVILDNISGGGPALELVNVFDINFADGWLNAGTFGPSAKITGGGRIRFTANTLFGGPAGDPKTYEFVGGSTDGFYSFGNYVPSNTIYHVPATGFPVNHFTEDTSILAVPIDTTNRIAEFRAGAGLRFGDKFPVDHVGGTPLEIIDGTTYTFDRFDQNKLLLSNSASPTTFTMDVLTPDWEQGTAIDVMQLGAGALSIAATGGAAILVVGSATAAAQFSQGQLTYLGGNLWKLVWFD